MNASFRFLADHSEAAEQAKAAVVAAGYTVVITSKEGHHEVYCPNLVIANIVKNSGASGFWRIAVRWSNWETPTQVSSHSPTAGLSSIAAMARVSYREAQEAQSEVSEVPFSTPPALCAWGDEIADLEAMAS